MWTVLITTLLVTGAADVEVRTLDGQQYRGRLEQLGAKELVVETTSGKTPLPIAKVARLAATRPAIAAKARAAVTLQLNDGSQLAGVNYAVQKGDATLELIDGEKLTLKTGLIAAVRFQDPSELTDKVAAQWSEILSQNLASDLIVIRKKGSIDHLEGVAGDVTNDNVSFTVDNDIVPVKRPKVEGLIYYHAAGAELPAAIGEVTDTQGARFQAKSIELVDQKLRVTTTGGLAVERPIESIALINFSVGKVKYLSDLDPELVKVTPYFTPRQDFPALAEFHKPRRDIGLEQNPLKLDGKTFAKGLALHSRTQVVYRLPDKFRLFKATVGIDDSVRSAGHAHLTISGDDKKLWEADVVGSEPAKDLELDVSGVKRLEIVVDYGRDLDIADHVDLCEAQITK